MNQKNLARLILILGFLITLIFATADFTGLGSHVGFGPQQTIGTIFGVFLILIGIVLSLQKKKSSS